MRISIIIPSYNQAPYLEETLRSVLDQDYSDLELIVIDGGSSDSSDEIIRRYENRIAYWISEKDRGQADAINKGLRRATGAVWSYLNSDDLLCPGALQTVAASMADKTVAWLGGVSDQFDETGVLGYVRPSRPAHDWEYLMPRNRSQQFVLPCSNVSFMRADITSKIGLFDDTFHYGMDVEYYVRAVFRAGIRPHLIDQVMGRWRWHRESKTMTEGLWFGFQEDEIRIAQKYVEYLDTESRKNVERETRRQRKYVAVQKASYFRHRGQLNRSLAQLLRSFVKDPGLLFYSPWLATLAHVCLVRRGTQALR